MTPLQAYLAVAGLLFAIGFGGIVTRRNAILVLMGIELMLNAANLNFIAFWKFGPTELRLLLVIGNLALFRWPIVLHGHYRLFDVGGLIGMVGMVAMAVSFTAMNICRLYRQERIP